MGARNTLWYREVGACEALATTPHRWPSVLPHRRRAKGGVALERWDLLPPVLWIHRGPGCFHIAPTPTDLTLRILIESTQSISHSLPGLRTLVRGGDGVEQGREHLGLGLLLCLHCKCHLHWWRQLELVVLQEKCRHCSLAWRCAPQKM